MSSFGTDSRTNTPPLWPASAQWGGLTLLAVLLGLVGWHLYAGSRWNTRPSRVVPDHRVELNRAKPISLEALPGIGPKLAARIVEYRTERGGFRSIDQLLEVKGIGPKVLAGFRTRLYLDGVDDPAGPHRPVPPRYVAKNPLPESYRLNVNKASLDELCRLPRIGPVLAQRILGERALRPFVSCDDLARVSGIGPKTVEGLRPYVVVDERVKTDR